MNTTMEGPATLDVGPDPDLPLRLSDQDRDYLATLEGKFQMVRDFTAGVALRYNNGFFLCGPGGCGKSHTVIGELRRQKVSHHVYNSHMSARGLFDALAKAPDSVIVLEDMEQIVSDRSALGIVRSALWGQRPDGGRGPQERVVTWSIKGKQETIYFTGGIILIANRPLGELPEMRAAKTRVASMHLHVTDDEMAALMRRVALEGHRDGDRAMEARECLEVAEYVIAESLSLHRPLDMRVQVNSFQDYLQYQAGDAGCHWHDLASCRLKERATAFSVPPTSGSQAERLQRDRDILREIVGATGDPQERLKLWEERTGKSQATMYRRLSEIDGGSFSDSQFSPN